MKKIKSLLVLTLFTTVILTSCATNEEPVKGVESSVNETGDVKAVKITANNCNVTQGVDATSKVLQTVNKDANLNVINKVNEDWYCVKLPNNQIGFVPQQQCTPVLPDNAINKGNAGQTPTPGKTPTPGTTPGTTPGKTPGTQTPGAANQMQPPQTGTGINNRQPIPGDTTGNNDNTVADDDAEDENTTTNKNISNEEQQLINLINESRKQNGLKALTADNQLSEVARIKSKDMIDNNYFSHNSPTYGNPFDMLKNFGIQYLSAAENIAGNNSVQEAHEALMNSPGHRKNILNPELTHVGVGIQKGSKYGYMFTELFIKK
ncbi:CAP domain-containing protein [Vallitalea guaymasensis]|uniref:CAP domain-containing protein n=1 Tax=Vallitalea guaymasensis TaxID=1185412 RepID=UPI001FA92362|nr:CAP domain-containing protein [Vallitalea guaymasensis]